MLEQAGKVKACREDWELSQEDRREVGDKMLEQAGKVQECGVLCQQGRKMHSSKVQFKDTQQ